MHTQNRFNVVIVSVRKIILNINVHVGYLSNKAFLR